MAWVSINCTSKILHMPIELEVIAPQTNNDMQRKTKVLILLHGAIGDRTSWLLRSQIAYFASKKNVCVVMPTGLNYFYVNTANGYRYKDFICEELPIFVKNMFHVSNDRQDWMIAGCSMGGYGAIRCGISYPEKFGYIAAFSGAFDVVNLYDECRFIDMKNVFGEKALLAESDDNLYKLMENAVLNQQKENLPAILVTCGEQDRLYDVNASFYEAFCKDYKMEFLHKPGEHEWDIWNDSIKCALEWFFDNEAYKEVF